MRLQQNLTADSSIDSSEIVAHSQPKTDMENLATRKHRAALVAGVCGVFVLAVAVAIVAVFVGRSFSSVSSSYSASENFDFDEIGTDGMSIRGSSSPAPTFDIQTPPPTDTVETLEPSISPSTIPSDSPSTPPTALPSTAPSDKPTPIASNSPSRRPTFPSPEPTRMPNTEAPITPVNVTSPTLLTFCVIADVPYFENEKAKLPLQIRNQMEDCEFLVHLGDIMKGEIGCGDEHYILVRDIMLNESQIPSFIVPGDNEWNDCGNKAAIDLAWGRWTEHFMHFEDNWNHSFAVVRNLDYRENFYFIRKRTLIFGLNIVNGRVHDKDEWFLRLNLEADWVKAIVEMNVPEKADGVIIMAHSKPTEKHIHFFDPIKRLIRNDLDNQVPFLYLHGDGHDFIYTQSFFNQPNFLRIQHEGGVRDPILKIMADPHHQGPEVHDAFQFDRQLYLE